MPLRLGEPAASFTTFEQQYQEKTMTNANLIELPGDIDYEAEKSAAVILAELRRFARQFNTADCPLGAPFQEVWCMMQTNQSDRELTLRFSQVARPS
jgi:hypothetical protein